MDSHVENELILTGPLESVQRLMARTAESENELHEKCSFAMAHGQTRLHIAHSQLAAPSGQNLTRIMIRRLLAWADEERLSIAVEPNCMTGNRSGLSGDPFMWEGDPFLWEGDPSLPRPYQRSTHPYPYVLPVGSNPAEGERLFWQQNAFQAIGLTDANGMRRSALANHTGQGVLVGVFDTLPSAPVGVDWLTLHPSAIPIQPAHPDPMHDLSDHGLVVSSLIHAVAPQAQIHLYEVLNASAQGLMFPLLMQLDAFINMAAGQPAVINLSLGSLCQCQSAPALTMLMKKATDLGMVICASAGNHAQTAAKSSSIPGAQIPASLPNVIAVAASNRAAHRASYSHRGDIAAPGGEDLGEPGPGDQEDIIGMSVSAVGAPSGFVCMDAGTSFSAPLITGAVALLMAAKINSGATLTSETHAQIRTALARGVHAPDLTVETLGNTGLGAGILHLGALFS